MLYHLRDTESEKIIRKYHLKDSYECFEIDDIRKLMRGVKVMLKHTLKKLQELVDVDLLNMMLYEEVKRYMVFMFHYQKKQVRPSFLDEYHNEILFFFHKNGYLKNKHKVGTYKLFSYKKKPFCVCKIFTFEYGEQRIVYYSGDNMAIDFTKYQINILRSRYERSTPLLELF